MIENEFYDKHIKAFGGRPEFKDFTVEKMVVDLKNRAAYEIVLGCDLKEKKGVYVFGNPGGGKTHVMKIKFNMIYLWKLKAIIDRAYDFRYPYWIEISEYLDGLRPGASQPTRLKQDALEAHWLFIDDLGASTKTEWAVDQVFQLLDARLRGGKQTFITSNFNPDELRDFYGERISSRVHELCSIVKLIGNDKRKV